MTNLLTGLRGQTQVTNQIKQQEIPQEILDMCKMPARIYKADMIDILDATLDENRSFINKLNDPNIIWQAPDINLESILTYGWNNNMVARHTFIKIKNNIMFGIEFKKKEDAIQYKLEH